MGQPHIVQLGKQRDQRADELPGIGQAHFALTLQIAFQRLHPQVFGHPVQGVVFGKKHQRFQHGLVVDLRQPLPAVVQVAGHGAEQRFAFGGNEHNAPAVLGALQYAGEEFLHLHLAAFFGIPRQIGGEQVIVVQHRSYAVPPGKHCSRRQGLLRVFGLRLFAAYGAHRFPLLHRAKAMAAKVRLRHRLSSFRFGSSFVILRVVLLPDGMGKEI